jgi:hypothetical protein
MLGNEQIRRIQKQRQYYDDNFFLDVSRRASCQVSNLCKILCKFMYLSQILKESKQNSQLNMKNSNPQFGQKYSHHENSISHTIQYPLSSSIINKHKLKKRANNKFNWKSHCYSQCTPRNWIFFVIQKIITIYVIQFSII